jgi:uncharacterized protein YdiU (UPF0061 family)
MGGCLSAQSPHLPDHARQPFHYRPEPVVLKLGPDFGDPVAAADFPAAILRRRNDRAASTVGLETLTDAEWIAAFRSLRAPAGQPGPIAMRYHGHQFRSYNPDLGDGRGFLFGADAGGGPAACSIWGPRAPVTTPWSRRATAA